MNILALDSSTKILSVALKKGDLYYKFSASVGFQHSEHLLSTIDFLIGTAGIKASDLDLVICPLGPGSFTGLRIGMATSKGLADGAGCSFKAIPTLDGWAARYSFYPGLIVPVLDARKNRFYTAFYQDGEKLTDDMDLSAEDLKLKLSGYDKILLTAPDAVMVSNLLKMDQASTAPDAHHGNALFLLEAGLREYNSSGGDPMNLGPVYLRKSEAELSLEKRI